MESAPNVLTRTTFRVSGLYEITNDDNSESKQIGAILSGMSLSMKGFRSYVYVYVTVLQILIS